MKVQVKETSLNTNNTTQGGIVTIKGEGKMVKVKSKYNDEEENVPLIPVESNGKEYNFYVYRKHLRQIIEVWGDDTLNWIDKQFQTFHVDNKLVITPIPTTSKGKPKLTKS